MHRVNLGVNFSRTASDEGVEEKGHKRETCLTSKNSRSPTFLATALSER